MNADALRKVADAIEGEVIQGFKYNQATYGSKDSLNCGTAACIAGWAVALTDGLVALCKMDADVVPRRGVEILDLSRAERASLFDPWPLSRLPAANEAVRTLRYAAEHGVIDWQAANEEGKS